MSLKDEDKLVFFDGLSNLLASGIPIMDALAGFEDDAPKNVKVIIKHLRESLHNGKNIHEALSVYPKIFDGVTLSLIESGEQSGTLDQVFETISKNLSEEIIFKNKIKSALVYPIVLSAVFLVMIIFILIYAVPKFKYVFTRLSANVPLPTKVIFFLSDALINYSVYIITASALLIVLSVVLIKTYRTQISHLASNLPLLSTLYNYLDIYRLSKTMYVLINAGVPLTNALRLIQNTVFKKTNLKRMTLLTKHAETGKEISVFLNTQKGFMSKTMINLIEFGEKSGTIEKSFLKISVLAQNKVQTTLDRIALLMEPLVISVMGAVVGAVMMSIIAPIYQLIGNLNVR